MKKLLIFLLTLSLIQTSFCGKHKGYDRLPIDENDIELVFNHRNAFEGVSLEEIQAQKYNILTTIRNSENYTMLQQNINLIFEDAIKEQHRCNNKSVRGDTLIPTKISSEYVSQFSSKTKQFIIKKIKEYYELEKLETLVKIRHKQLLS